MAVELATAYVSLVPSAIGLGAAVKSALAGVGLGAGADLGTALASSATSMQERKGSQPENKVCTCTHETADGHASRH